jgi:hypothetical protein
VSPDGDQRVSVIDKTLEMSKAQQRALMLRLYRINMSSNQFEIKNSNKQFAEDGFLEHSQQSSHGMGTQMDLLAGSRHFGGGSKRKADSGLSGSHMI